MSAQEIWPDDKNKAAQKDIDARWTLKIGGKVRYRADGTPLPMIALPFFGYKSRMWTTLPCKGEASARFDRLRSYVRATTAAMTAGQDDFRHAHSQHINDNMVPMRFPEC